MSLQIQVTADVASASRQIQDFSKKSTNALTSLSLALQDLPFGFIGIQNNLPGIIKGFQDMGEEAKNGASVLSQLKGALIGPAGLYLAFSAVTAIVTKITLEYGSLGAALDALFTKQTKFNEVIIRASLSLKEYNKAIITNNEISGQAAASQNGQVLTARALLATILNLSKTEAERKNALERLKKLDEERFKNFDIEKGKINGLEEAVEGYTRALIAQSVASKFVDQVSNTSVELEKQRNALQELYDQLDLLEKTYPNLAKEAKNYRKELIESQGRLGAGMVEPAKGVLDYISTFKKIGEQEGVIKGLVKQLEDLNTATLKAVQSASALASPFAEKELKGKKPKKEKELDLEELSRKARYAANKLQEQADKNRLKYLQEQLKLEEKITKETFAQADKDMKADAEAFTKISFENLGKKLNPILEMLNNMAIGAKNVAILMEETFFNPLNEMFTTLFTKFTFSIKSFTNAILQSIAQIAAKLATTLVIQGLVSLFSAPLALGGALSPDGALGFIGKALSGMKSGKSADFSGVQGANMVGMSGSVNLVLRGTDLVGSINRTNSQISRVG
jgi:hypothetical protein